LHNLAKQRDVAVEVSRRLPNNCIELRTTAAVDIIVAPGADHAIAMNQPRAT
jgi:hypothetical protein